MVCSKGRMSDSSLDKWDTPYSEAAPCTPYTDRHGHSRVERSHVDWLNKRHSCYSSPHYWPVAGCSLGPEHLEVRANWYGDRLDELWRDVPPGAVCASVQVATRVACFRCRA